MAGDRQVLRTRSRVSRRGIVGQDDSGGSQGQRRPEDLARLKGRDVEATDRDLLAADRLVARIQIEDRKALLQAAPELLELQKRLARRGDRRGRAVGPAVPPRSKPPPQKEAANLGGPEPVPASRRPQIARLPLDDTPLSQQRS